MKSCGKRFHDEVGKFRFLNELIKVVSPKVGASIICSDLCCHGGLNSKDPRSREEVTVLLLTQHKHRPFLKVPFTQLDPGQLGF